MFLLPTHKSVVRTYLQTANDSCYIVVDCVAGGVMRSIALQSRCVCTWSNILVRGVTHLIKTLRVLFVTSVLIRYTVQGVF